MILENKDSFGSESMMARFWWIFLLRGIAALLLGITLLLQQDQTRSTMIKYIGIYLLASGILSFLWGISVGRHVGLWSLAGFIGVVGGLLFIFHSPLEDLITDLVLVLIFGLIMLIAGLMHIFGGFRTGTDYGRAWSWGSLLLGSVEIILAMMMLASSWVPIEIITIVGCIWGFAAGIGLIVEALRLRKLVYYC
ncbi:HdeD family acid-resistance protein [Chloroflexota bacterium]